MRTGMILFAVAMVFATGCGKKAEKLDMRSVEVNSQADHISVSIERCLISSADPAINESCNIFNSHIENFVAELQNKVKVQAATFFSAEENQTGERDSLMFKFTVRDEVFRADSRYVSVCVSVYAFTGGANAPENIYAFNYDVAARKFIDSKQIVDHSKSAQVDEALKARFSNPDGCFTSEPTLEKATALNFSSDMLIFTYAHYVLGPRACGDVRIEIPITEIKGALVLK